MLKKFLKIAQLRGDRDGYNKNSSLFDVLYTWPQTFPLDPDMWKDKSIIEKSLVTSHDIVDSGTTL